MSPDEGQRNEQNNRLRRLNRALKDKARQVGHPDQLSADEDVVGPERQLTRLLEIAKAMNRIHDQDELLVYVNDRLRELFDAQNSFVVLFDGNGEPIIQASYVQDPSWGALPVSRTLLEQVRSSREPVIVGDVSNHSELRNQHSIEELKIASAMCAPLVVDDDVIGVLQFDHRRSLHPFLESDLRLLALFSDQVAATLCNLRLIKRVQDALDEVKSAQSKVVEAERLSALGEMAGGIAHNFNNTLFVAQGLCEVLLAREDVTSEVRATVERIRTCSLDATDTVRRLISFSTGQTGGREDLVVYPAKVAAELPLLTRHKWEDEARMRGVEIKVVVQSEVTPPVNAKPAELREVLTNLIFNAVDSMVSNGTIMIRTGARGGRVFIEVEDEGIGMSEKVKRQIYEPFFTTKGARGTGFGLSTCWSIMRSLDGEIDVDSVEGQGTKFTIWLPEVSVAVNEDRPSCEERTSLHVLVVDDDPEVRDTIVELTKLLGYRVSGFASGQKLLATLSSGERNLLISDVGMPEMDGNELVRQAKAAQPNMPVILLSGWGADVTLKPDVADMVEAVLAKPVSLELLKGTIAEAVRKSMTSD